MGSSCLASVGFLFGWYEYFGNRPRWWLYNIVNVLGNHWILFSNIKGKCYSCCLNVDNLSRIPELKAGPSWWQVWWQLWWWSRWGLVEGI
jgi:hypothetical protein